ncbi:DUF952 domain-containing protein [Streptomyces roseicoloratus]|uniref:DUF952 domain-containing protein n=1 Tax=Streptomyces roseicoloratus TaxID=2508722 RepID=A0ABY9S0F5_9ACTN|nr:DUF952 domain-containing protein [Streptomyces roseicoloratus]WMX47765.1 DUF952 domain-containing protein [Streptomyces roseicoloratus]
MLLHVVPLDEWSVDPGLPYAPPSLAAEGFVHCSPDETTALAIADAHYRDVPGPLLVLVLDASRLGGEVRWEGSDGMLFPHVYGPIERAAVTAVLEVRRDADGRARELAPRA